MNKEDFTSLIDRLFQTPSITIRQAADLLEVSPQAASNNIQKLGKAGILHEVTGQKRNQVFLASEILNFLHDRVPVMDEDDRVLRQE